MRSSAVTIAALAVLADRSGGARRGPAALAGLRGGPGLHADPRAARPLRRSARQRQPAGRPGGAGEAAARRAAVPLRRAGGRGRVRDARRARRRCPASRGGSPSSGSISAARGAAACSAARRSSATGACAPLAPASCARAGSARAAASTRRPTPSRTWRRSGRRSALERMSAVRDLLRHRARARLRARPPGARRAADPRLRGRPGRHRRLRARGLPRHGADAAALCPARLPRT